MSSGTIADPMKPVAPVRNTRILFSPSNLFAWRINRRMARSVLAAIDELLRQISGDCLRLQSFFGYAHKRKQASVRKLRSEAQRNRERILEIAKEAFTR